MKFLHLFDHLMEQQKSYDVNSTSKAIQTSVKEDDTEIKESFLNCRYTVVLMGFGVYCFLNIHRMNMNVSIVAMVNNTAQIDDSNFSTSCPVVIDNDTTSISEKARGEFDWSPDLQGYIIGSSSVGYLITQFIAGKLSEIWGCKWILFCGLLFASVCNFLTPFASWWNVHALIATQIVRGMAQGVYQPTLSVLIANWFPKIERGFLSSLMLTGLCIGALVGGSVSGILCDSSLFGGWPSVFYIFGVAGVVLAILIAIFLYENPRIHKSISNAELKYILNNQETTLLKNRPSTPWRTMFTSLPVYALALAYFGQLWMANHFLAVQPTFLSTILHVPIKMNGIFTSVPFVLQTIMILIASWISKTLNRKGYVGVNKLRKFWNLAACVGYSTCLLGIYFAACNETLSVVFSILSMGFVGFNYAGCMTVPPEMSPTFAGSVMGLSCTVGTIASFILPVVVGYLTDDAQTLEQWNKFFFISIGIVMSTGITFAVFGSAEVQKWNNVDEKYNLKSAKKEQMG